jgi:hypothetical protein
VLLLQQCRQLLLLPPPLLPMMTVSLSLAGKGAAEVHGEQQ